MSCYNKFLGLPLFHSIFCSPAPSFYPFAPLLTREEFFRYLETTTRQLLNFRQTTTSGTSARRSQAGGASSVIFWN